MKENTKYKAKESKRKVTKKKRKKKVINGTQKCLPTRKVLKANTENWFQEFPNLV
jgi:hypothetical protein